MGYEYKTSKTQFKLFQDECWKWINIFGLKGYEYTFEHDDSDTSARAHFGVNVVGRVAVITLTKTWGLERPTDLEVKKSAFHEICEVLLVRLNDIASQRGFCEEDLEEEIHNVIRILENTLFHKYK